MEKSLVVTGRSLEEALEKSAVLLHCPRETIVYETLREGMPAARGHDPVLWKIKATPIAPAPDDAVPAAAPDGWTVDIPLPGDWHEWAALPSSDFMAHLTVALAAVPPPRSGTPMQRDVAALGPPRAWAGDFGRAEHILTHDGHLRIEGNVRRGTRIFAAGTLHVAGDVETAHLEAGGSVSIAGGLLGTARSLRGDVSCRFAQGARLSAPQGSVRVRESSMHSRLEAGKAVHVGHVCLGGTAYAEEQIEISTAGSLSGVPTLLTAGRNLRLLQDAEEARAEAAGIVKRLAEWNAQSQEWAASEEAGRALPPAQRRLLWQTQARLVRAHEHLDGLALKKTASLGMINQSHGSRICVEGRAYPKVRVTVDDAGCELQTLTQFATFSKDYESGELRVTPFR